MSVHPDGRDWRTYFHDYQQAQRASLEPVAEADIEQPEIVEPAYELSAEQLAKLPGRSTPAQVVKRLLANKWDVRAQKRVVHMPPVRYASSSDEGAKVQYQAGAIRYPDYFLEVTAIGAVKRDANGRIGLAMFATWNDKNGFQIAETYDPLDGREIRVGFTKGREPNQIEIEEGIAPPLGLKEWLLDFAPLPADQKQKLAKAAKVAEQRGEWIG
ncbi:hypothetical protein [Microbacterium sp. 69-7]|uniref:hypothetical protein n=1 Tax=Microbacterium sp. 69-7 TaxID=1895784 RepID=UPI000AC4AE3A|nr:hypothetical protein [Microbacterium sp. 69-7]